MRKNFNIDKYLDEAEERFSGFDGYDDFDGDYDSFDDYDNFDDDYDNFDDDYDNFDDDYDNFDNDHWDLAEGDYSEARGRRKKRRAGSRGASRGASRGRRRVAAPQPQLKTPSPYVINVSNTTGSQLTLVLFGLNTYLLTANFGSAAGLVVTPGQTNVSYLQLLQQSANQPFETSLVRVESNNANQITQILTVTIADANGQSATLPIITSSYFSSYQQQSLIVDVPYKVKIDGNTSITTSILAATTSATYTFFPAEKVNVAYGLSGKGAVQAYGNPQVNLGGMAYPKSQNPRVMMRRPRRRIN